MIAAYKEFEARVGSFSKAPGAKGQLGEDCVRRLPTTFKISELINACPGIPRLTINLVLSDLQAEGHVECSGRGRAAVWRKLKD